MAKILTDKEMSEIISRAVNDLSTIDCSGAYEHFLEDLADLICTHFGGTAGTVSPPDDALPWTVAFKVNECVPDDGGVFADYDTDVAWKNGKES